jgi:hypothetical protein
MIYHQQIIPDDVAKELELAAPTAKNGNNIVLSGAHYRSGEFKRQF